MTQNGVPLAKECIVLQASAEHETNPVMILIISIARARVYFYYM